MDAAANGTGAGWLDRTFGNGGAVLVPTASTSRSVDARVAVGPTGRIFVLSLRQTLAGGFRTELTAFTSSGRLDQTFHGGRLAAVLTIPVSDPLCCAIAGPFPTMDGGVEVVVGRATAWVARRYTASGNLAWSRSMGHGSIDAASLAGASLRVLSFDLGSSGAEPGPLTLDGLTPAGQPDVRVGPGGVRDLDTLVGPAAILADPLNRLYVFGNRYADPPAGDRLIQLRRLSSSGVLDPTYGTGGLTEIPVDDADDSPGSGGRFGAAAMGPDGSLIIAGNARHPASGRQVVAVRHVMPDGTLDATFADGGLLYFTGPTGSARFAALGVDASGRILLSFVARSGSLQPMIARLDGASGALDTSLGSGGWLPVAGLPTGIEVTGDGKVLTVSRIARDGQLVLYLARRGM